MCLDVNTYSFSSSTYGNTKGAVILTIFTIAYWFLAFSFLNLFMILLDTLSKVKPMVTYITVYLLIGQKLVRVFIINEKERLEEFMEQSRHNIVTLGEFYDIKSSGYESQKRVHPKTGREQEFHKILYKDSTEEHVVKFLRGSITSEFADTETAQVKLTCNFISTLMKQGIIPRIVISDERIERAVVFKFYQHKLREGNFSESFIDFCNSTLLYHESNAEMYSRITANYLFIPSRTARQKIFMDNFVKNVGSNLGFSTFREISLLNKQQILTMYKDLNALNTINELALQTEEAKNRVPLGLTKSLYIKNIITGEVKELSTDDNKMRININDIEYKVLRKVATQQNQDSVKELTRDMNETEEIEDLFNSVELPELKDIQDNTNDLVGELDLPEPSEPIDVNSLMEKVNPYEVVSKSKEIKTLITNGVFNFKSIEQETSTIDKSVMLLTTLQSDDCDVIIL